jgi:pimeloyl-ACP methyl ester carboxylesterase
LIAETDAPIRRAFVDGPFGQMHVRSTPKVAQAAPLILLHPSPYSGAYYKDLMRILAPHRQTIAIDTPGFGASAPPPELIDLDDYASAFGQALDGLGLGEGPLDVLGFHTGAMMAVALGLHRPHCVRRLVLAGLPFLVGEAREAAYRNAARPPSLTEDGRHLLDYWQHIVVQRHPAVSLTLAQQRYNDFAPSFPDGWRAYHALYRYPADDKIPLLTQPVLLLLIHEILLSGTLAAEPLFQRCERIDLPDLGKNAFDIAPEIIAAAINPFLDGAKQL